ncbi:MAG: glycosyltransferase family 39 protein [Rhodospirillales bacterium]|nr:glycosyltransferase family 39 protein [Rhodospirillales bacterium]
MRVDIFKPLDREALIWSALWLCVVATALIARPLMPIDETRYLAVAWEMWLRGDFLVPHLNGETYSHKPPLLFWLINAGWAVFGLNEWWPRAVAPLFGLGSLFLTTRLAGRLWPDEPDIRRLAPFLLVGSLFFAVFTTLTMFDMILAFLTLLGLCGLLSAWRGDFWIGFGVLGVAIGLGVLAKGPAILLHTVPIAVLAPLWGPGLDSDSDTPTARRRSWAVWYGGIVGAVVLGAAIGLAWAIPAAKAGGEDYGHAIFWGQSAGRMVDSFAHGRPWWWYLAALPVMALPWLIWPSLWKTWRNAKPAFLSGAGRFCASWFLPAFIVFSAISGKQPHYLLPEFPALALFGALLLTKLRGAPKRPRLDIAIPAVFFLVVGGVIGVIPFLPVQLPHMAERLQPFWGILLVLAGVMVIVLARKSLLRNTALLSALSVLAVAFAHLAARPALVEVYDISPIAHRLGAWQQTGHPIAHYGKYHGQFQFLGRLRDPVAIIGDQEAAEWVAKNPTGKIVSYHSKAPNRAGPEMVLRFRGKWMAVWDAAKAAKDLDILKRR